MTSADLLHVFNSSSVAGPEVLTIPSLAKLSMTPLVVNLGEQRLAGRTNPLESYCKAHTVQHKLVTVTSRIDWNSVRNLREIITISKAKLVHTHDVKASLYTLLALISCKKRPVLVSTHHGVLGRPDLKTRIYERFYSRCLLPFFDCITVVSNFDRDLLLKTGLTTTKVKRLANGVDRPFLKREERDEVQKRIRTSWGLQNTNCLVLGVVGRLSAEKNHARLLHCLAELKRLDTRPWVVLCFGSGELKEELKKISEKLQVTEHVRWMGYRPEIGQEFGGFDLLLSFSKGEGMPISFLESGWAGTPIFSSAVGGVPEMISDKKNGFLFSLKEQNTSLAETLADILSQPTYLHEIGQNFQQHVLHNFSGEAWRKQLTACYEALLQ
jgi:glycosyltransferase involved in cell wall biosynthesis